MPIPYTNERLVKPKEYEIRLDKWQGLNCSDTKPSDGEFVRMKNIGCNGRYVYPRPPREVIANDIQNPAGLLFCGDNLAYIDGGKLYVNSDDGFVIKGDVGEVSSVVNFSNDEILFFPSNIVYNVKKDELSAITSYLGVENGNYSIDDSTQCDNVTIAYEKCGSTIKIINGDDNYIYASELKDEDGNTLKDENGKIKYASVTVNVSGVDGSWLTDNLAAGIGHCRLFYKAWDENDNLITSSFRWTRFGEEISITNAKKFLMQIGFFYINSTSSTYMTACSNQRKKCMNNSSFKVWLTESSYPAPNSRPHIDYACVDNNRVAGVSGNNFYASSLGDYSNWTDFVDASGNPKATGAYAEELSTSGSFTAAVKYRSTILLLKKDMLYECYGGKPPYRIRLEANSGCVDAKSIVEINGVMYWLGLDAVYRYSGSLPVNISRKINGVFGSFISGCAASDGRRYYLYAKDKNGGALVVYDTVTGLWCMEDSTEFVDMLSQDNIVYALSADGVIYKFSSGTEQVEWELETKNYDFGLICKKKFKKMSLRVEAQQQCGMDIYIKYDNGEFARIASFCSSEKGVADIKINPKKCDSFALMFKGIGNVKITGLFGTVISSSKFHNNKTELIKY